MKLSFRSLLGLTAVAVLLLAMPGHAAPIKYTGELSLRSPIWANQDNLVAAPTSEVSTATLVRRNFERRFDGEDLDRVFVGAKLGFTGRLD